MSLEISVILPFFINLGIIDLHCFMNQSTDEKHLLATLLPTELMLYLDEETKIWAEATGVGIDPDDVIKHLNTYLNCSGLLPNICPKLKVAVSIQFFDKK